MCCYKDFKNFERFNNIVQIILTVAIRFIQTLPIDYEKECEEEENSKREQEATKSDEAKSEGGTTDEQKSDGDSSESKKDEVSVDDVEMEEEEHWSIEEKEKLLQFITKVFLMNFPSYLAYKHVVHSSLEVLVFAFLKYS